MEKTQALIDNGCDLNEKRSGTTPAMVAVGWGGQYDLAIMLLEAGADYRIYQEGQNSRLIHFAAAEKDRLSSCSPKQRLDYSRLVLWLEQHGETLTDAEKDFARWRSWDGTPAKIKMLRESEIAARLAREARELSRGKNGNVKDGNFNQSATDRTK